MTTPLLHTIIRMLQLQLLLAPRILSRTGAVGAYSHFSSQARSRRGIIRLGTSSDHHYPSRHKFGVSSSHTHGSPLTSSSSFELRRYPSVALNYYHARRHPTPLFQSSTSCGTDTNDDNAGNDVSNSNSSSDDDHDQGGKRASSPDLVVARPPPPPWSLPSLKSTSSKTYSRFRQHVNPLSRRYTMPTELPLNWPTSVFDNVELPLYLDIGCGKGGFLLELARKRGRCRSNSDEGGTVMRSFACNDDEEEEEEEEEDIEENQRLDATDSTSIIDTGSSMTSPPPSSSLWHLPSHMNYLGLEIRPGVSQYAQARVAKRKLDGVVSFVGCNANVDLDRLLTLYHGGSVRENENYDNGGGGGTQHNVINSHRRRLAFVSIQFPDPHFKKAHTKRRVVTSQLVSTLAKFMEEGSAVFLQSDVKDALVSMRDKFIDEDEVDDGGRGNDGERMNAVTPLGAARYFDEIVLSNGTKENEERVEFGMVNPLGVPTEREKSVLANGLPVYRTMFRRNGIAFDNS